MSVKRNEADATDDPLLPSGKVREEFGGISNMTVHRWVANGTLPKPKKINGRNYWRQSWIARVKGDAA
jgi:predicted DNA-binding transcriptional regulator AlpA